MVVLLVLSLLPKVALSFKQAGRVPGELFRFDFTEGQGTIASPAAGTALSSAQVGNLSWASSTAIAWNAPGAGNGLTFTSRSVQNDGLQSTATGYAVENALRSANTSFTFELWFSTSNLLKNMAIVGWNTLASPALPTSCGAMQLSLWSLAGFVATASINAGDGSCTYTNFGGSRVSANAIVHAVWTGNGPMPNFDPPPPDTLYWKQKLYLNKVPVSTLDYQGPMRLDLTGLNLWVGKGSSSDFLGKVYMIAMYDRVLNDSEVSRNYDAWMVNSAPLSQNQTMTVQEDVIYDITANLVWSDFDNSPQPVTQNDSFIIKLYSLPAPGKGSLYYGTAGNKKETLISSPSEVPNGKSLYYLTAPNAPTTTQTPYTSFRFSVCDGEDESETYTLSINANTVADPPETWDQSWTVYRGAKTKITILSRGVDGVSKPFDFTCKFPILPNGTLSEVWGIFNLYPSTYTTSSKIKPPQDRDELSDPLPRKANFELTYKSSTAPSPDEAEGITVVGTDSFRFQLNDTKTSLLSNGVFNITILNHIYSSDQDLAALEDSNVTLTVQYTDKMKEQDNNLPHSGRVVVESLPGKGTLYYGGTAVQAGAVVPSVQLSYVAAPLNWYGSTSFTFHVRVCSTATDPCTGDLWYSGRHTATIVVAPVDDPPIITFNEALNAANINANGYFSLMTSKTQYKTFTIAISDIEGGGLYTVRVKSVSGSGSKGSLRFDPPPPSTGVTTDKDADDPYYSPQVFGGNLTQIQAALTDFKVYGATSGYTNITVEIWSKPLSDWSSYDAADFSTFIPTEVVPGPEEPFKEWQRYAVYGGAAACLLMSVACCFWCTRRCQHQGAARYAKEHAGDYGHHAGTKGGGYADSGLDRM